MTNGDYGRSRPGSFEQCARSREDHAPEKPPRSARYDRRADLPRVLPLWRHELDDESPQGRRRVVARLARALRTERRRGIAGHWTYDLARHVELLRLYRLEREAAGRPNRPTQHAQPASSMLKKSLGATTSPNAMRKATATTKSASSARNCSALKRCE